MARIRTIGAYVAPPPWPVERFRAEDQTWLYRLFDARGILLYVGITRSPYRLEAHRRKPWGRGIAYVEWEWFFHRRRALNAEAAAIVAERPLMNVALPAACVGVRLA